MAQLADSRRMPAHRPAHSIDPAKRLQLVSRCASRSAKSPASTTTEDLRRLRLIVDTSRVSVTELSDGELVNRIQAGSDPAAESALVQRYSRGLQFMLTQRCGDPELAKDLHQEAFVIVLRRLRDRGLDDPGRLKAFLHRTGVNLVIGDYRREQRRDTHADLDRIGRCADQAEDAVSRVLQSQAAKLIRKLIGELKMPRDRELLERFYLREEDKQSICRDLSLDTLHFDRVLFRARQRLKSLAQRSAGVTELRT